MHIYSSKSPLGNKITKYIKETHQQIVLLSMIIIGPYEVKTDI